MNRSLGLIVTMFAFSCQAVAAPTEQIKWVSAELPPFVWQNNNAPQGYAYELIAAMSAHMGRQTDLNFYPWARAIKMTAEGSSYGVFPLARTPDRETGYKWLIPLATVKYTFFGRRPALAGKIDIEHATMGELRGLRIGLLRGSPIASNLLEKNFQHIVYEKNYQDLLRMLALGGIDAIYAGYPMLIAAIKDFGFHFEDICIGASLGSAELYLAASPGLNMTEERAWQNAYETLLKDGTVTRLQDKYAIPK